MALGKEREGGSEGARESEQTLCYDVIIPVDQKYKVTV